MSSATNNLGDEGWDVSRLHFDKQQQQLLVKMQS